MQPKVLLIGKKQTNKKNILKLGLQSFENTIITMETCRNSLLDFNEGFQSKNQCCCCPCTLLAAACSVTGSKICILTSLKLDSGPALVSRLHWFEELLQSSGTSHINEEKPFFAVLLLTILTNDVMRNDLPPITAELTFFLLWKYTVLIPHNDLQGLKRQSHFFFFTI